jgi:hypothetical protein
MKESRHASSAREKAIGIWLLLLKIGNPVAAQALLEQINTRNLQNRWPGSK